MARARRIARPPGVTHAVTNTGPLISAFQSNSVGLVTQIFPVIYVPPACVVEVEAHTWKTEIRAAGKQLVIVKLTRSEEKQARAIARKIARHPASNDPAPATHLGEAQTIVLSRRPAHRNDVLLLDEMAARAIAREAGLRFSGFPGVLLLAVQGTLISAEELKARLELCRASGTHYGAAFIQRVYEMARQGRRRP
jgi:predicted nucleic acid-binding protein